eukprot:g58833.t1
MLLWTAHQATIQSRSYAGKETSDNDWRAAERATYLKALEQHLKKLDQQTWEPFTYSQPSCKQVLHKLASSTPSPLSSSPRCPRFY